MQSEGIIEGLIGPISDLRQPASKGLWQQFLRRLPKEALLKVASLSHIRQKAPTRFCISLERFCSYIPTLLTRPGALTEIGKSKHWSREYVYFASPVKTVQPNYVLSQFLDQSVLTT